MADTRGLKVNKDIYNFESMMYRMYDIIPVKHKHTLSELALKSSLEMRHYCNLACKMYKGSTHRKAELFSLALGYCEDVQDSLDHLYDINLLSNKVKSMMDVELENIREQLSRLMNYFEKAAKGAERSEYADCGDSINQEEG